MKITPLDKEKLRTKEWQPEYDMLLKMTLQMRRNAYTIYSQYKVGALLVTADGHVFTGCNIENAAYGPSICAERVALVKAISEGYTEFSAIFIIGGSAEAKGGDIATPCGVCRQVMREFCNPNDFYIICPKADEEEHVSEYQIFTLDELLPESFGPDHLLK